MLRIKLPVKPALTNKHPTVFQPSSRHKIPSTFRRQRVALAAVFFLPPPLPDQTALHSDQKK